MNPTGIERLVCEDIARRQQLGIKKYGTTVEANPLVLSEWIQHAFEETLDLAVYLKRAHVEILNREACKIHSCHPDCKQPACVQRRELAELRKTVEKLHCLIFENKR